METVIVPTLDTPIITAYKTKLNQHIQNVWEAGDRLGVPKDQLLLHDASKFSNEELSPYAQWHAGDRNNPEEYTRAWLHHLHNNPHHLAVLDVPSL